MPALLRSCHSAERKRRGTCCLSAPGTKQVSRFARNDKDFGEVQKKREVQRGLMPTLWFMIVAVMVAAYVVLDGFDLGAGAIYLAAARSGDDRRKIMRAIGPVWDGNEVWLLAAGGTLYFAFPMLYASSFSGFYLPLMMVLWLLM